MSKGYSEALALIEAGKQMALGVVKEKPMRTHKPKEPDILALLEQKRREYEGLKIFVENQVKLNKPEEKKDKEKKVWDRQDIALLLIATTPLTGPFYVMWFKTMLGM